MSRTTAFFILLSIGAVFAQTTPDRTKWRTIDGYGNNVANPTWGTPGSQLRRMGPAVYGDGISTDRYSVVGVSSALPSPRVISNKVHPPAPGGKQPANIRGLSDYTTYWGQFIDHDLDLTGGPKGSAIPLEPVIIQVPAGDAFFDPASFGNVTMTISRSIYDKTTGTGTANPRQQITLITSYLDGSQVYGSDNTTASALRTFSNGLMRTSMLNGLEMPPLNDLNITNANDAHVVGDAQLYLLGDVRGNENPALTSLHTLFLREHNRRARDLKTKNPGWTDEELYQESRRWVIALLQHITFEEYLPITVGDAAPDYLGYNATLDPTILTEFSSGAFRYGHSEVAEKIWRINATGQEIPEGHLQLRNSYFNSPTTVGLVGKRCLILI